MQVAVEDPRTPPPLQVFSSNRLKREKKKEKGGEGGKTTEPNKRPGKLNPHCPTFLRKKGREKKGPRGRQPQPLLCLGLRFPHPCSEGRRRKKSKRGGLTDHGRIEDRAPNFSCIAHQLWRKKKEKGGEGPAARRIFPFLAEFGLHESLPREKKKKEKRREGGDRRRLFSAPGPDRLGCHH